MSACSAENAALKELLKQNVDAINLFISLRFVKGKEQDASDALTELFVGTKKAYKMVCADDGLPPEAGAPQQEVAEGGGENDGGAYHGGFDQGAPPDGRFAEAPIFEGDEVIDWYSTGGL